MAFPFPNFHAWLWRNPNPDPTPNTTSNPNPNFPVSSADSYAALDVDSCQFSLNPNFKKSVAATQSRKVYGSNRRRVQRGRRKIQSLDLDFDMVLVPSDCFSGSESEGSDWSVGWFEPHAPGFCSEGETENRFAVLVPCYGAPSPDSLGGKARFGQEENPNSKSQLWAAVLSNIAKDSHAETNHYLQQWVSSLQS